jgi:hypothetical protein
MPSPAWSARLGGHARLCGRRRSRRRAGDPAGGPVLPRTRRCRSLARCSGTSPKASTVPVVAHLDHGYTFEECREALDSGFTSLMYDGSRKPLAQNIEETARIAELAHSAGISCEGEIGFVGYRRRCLGRHGPGGGCDLRPQTAAWTPWRFRSAMCICSRTGRRAG